MSALHELLDELFEQLGPPDEEMVTETMEELTMFVDRVQAADLSEQPDRRPLHDR